MKKMVVLMNHTLTDEQLEDAKNLGVSEVVLMNSALKERFSNVPPELEALDTFVTPFVEFIKENANPEDYIFIQGEPGLTYKLVRISKALGYVPIYATTKRESVEKEVDGKIVKTSVFKHVRFREY